MYIRGYGKRKLFLSSVFCVSYFVEMECRGRGGSEGRESRTLYIWLGVADTWSEDGRFDGAGWVGADHAAGGGGAALRGVARGVEALAGKQAWPGRRAVGHWIPIAAAALVAVAIHRGDMAISIIFATSVGCLSLVVGSICIVSANLEAPAAQLRVWPFATSSGAADVAGGVRGGIELETCAGVTD